MKLNVDNKQRLKTSMSFFLEFYKILMGTFLIAFVPQNCEGNVCSMMDNIKNTNGLHFAANVSNLATFIAVLNFYYRELKRENWCITYLDIDADKPNNYLDDQIENYPIIKKNMHVLNKKYLQSTKIALLLLIFNFAISSVSIGYDYVGTNTATSLVSFFMLVSTKLNAAYSVGKKSVEDEHALSSYLKTYKTYNTIDADFVLDDDKITIEEIKEVEKNEDMKEDTNEVSETSIVIS